MKPTQTQSSAYLPQFCVLNAEIMKPHGQQRSQTSDPGGRWIRLFTLHPNVLLLNEHLERLMSPE